MAAHEHSHGGGTESVAGLRTRLTPKGLSNLALAGSIAFALFVAYPIACGLIARFYKRQLGDAAESHASTHAAGSPGRPRKSPSDIQPQKEE